MSAGYAQVAGMLAAADHLCLTAHEAPDGDALGSLLGLTLTLQAAGRDVVPFLPGTAAFPQEYRFLDLTCITRTPPADLAARDLWALDCGSAMRITRDDVLLATPRRIVNVDHHHDNTRFGAVNLVDPGASCTAEMLARLIADAGLPLPLNAAEALYVGLVTDTGRFQYANTTPAALRLAGDLVEKGVEPARVFANIWETVPLAKQRLLGLALSRARSECDGRLLVTWLERADFEAAGAEDPFSEGIIDQMRAVEGVEVAALIREPREPVGPRWKGSLRARAGGRDVSAIARLRGGGGHIGAAGFSTDESLDEIVAFLCEAVETGAAAPAP